jgi:hypothetical protein
MTEKQLVLRQKDVMALTNVRSVYLVLVTVS